MMKRNIPINIFYYFYILFVLCFSSLLIANEKNSRPYKLEKNEGLLLIKLDIDGLSPTLNYVTKSAFGIDRELVVNSGIDSHKDGDNIVRFLLIPFREGNYQITSVNAPFYDLPYRLVTRGDERWSFKIEPGRINYIGLLEIDRERTSRSINVNLIDRFATDYDLIKCFYSELLDLHPLANGKFYRDDFYTDFFGEPDDQNNP